MSFLTSTRENLNTVMGTEFCSCSGVMVGVSDSGDVMTDIDSDKKRKSSFRETKADDKIFLATVPPPLGRLA